ncbi:MAG: YjjG family noncanonical pyrimidine nucleotidase [Bacteroidota bacterium]|nr:YjjG family noncanonical pyrimidine nucleotidase [Bacteroidota bacterium]
MILKPYKHIFFDLDHTLWDFEKNSTETLIELYDRHQMHELKQFSKEEFIKTFHEVNHFLWACYHKGTLERQTLRSERFKIIFSKLNCVHPYSTSQLTEEYLSLCPTKTNLFPYALEVLNYLKQKYILHIITNGFEEVQFIKMASSRIRDFFVEIVTSDASGFIKPHKGMFEYALHKTKAYCTDCIMIGDDLDADIVGARNASIDHVYFNPSGLKHQEAVTHEIRCLSQLMKIL